MTYFVMISHITQRSRLLHKNILRLLVPILALVALSTALFFGGVFGPSISHAATGTISATSTSGSFPPGWRNHHLHINPSRLAFDMTDINFTLTGDGLPPLVTLTFISDLGMGVAGERCASNTIDGTTVLVSVDGKFPPQPESAKGCHVGEYLIEAIDPLYHVYPAILTISS